MDKTNPNNVWYSIHFLGFPVVDFAMQRDTFSHEKLLVRLLILFIFPVFDCCRPILKLKTKSTLKFSVYLFLLELKAFCSPLMISRSVDTVLLEYLIDLIGIHGVFWFKFSKFLSVKSVQVLENPFTFKMLKIGWNFQTFCTLKAPLHTFYQLKFQPQTHWIRTEESSFYPTQ